MIEKLKSSEEISEDKIDGENNSHSESVDVQNENSTKECFEPLSTFGKGKINWVGVVSFGNALDHPLYVHQIGTTQIHLQPGYEAV